MRTKGFISGDFDDFGWGVIILVLILNIVISLALLAGAVWVVVKVLQATGVL